MRRRIGGRWALLAAVSSFSLGCEQPSSNEEREATSSNQFFENSVRRDASSAEASRVVQLVTSGCAAFFLENSANKTFLATARHCVEFAITSWCERDGAIVDNDGRRGRCTRIIAADVNRDIAVFEADLAHASTGSSTLRLASYVPKVGTKLIMTGYPADRDPQTARNGKLTTTHSCWVLSGQVASPYTGYDTNTLDPSALHNCSTYGGNSGGPMYIEGTRDAIGKPFTYLPDDYKRYSATDLSTAAYLALMSDFVKAYRAELTQAQIVISDSPESSGDSPSSDPAPDRDDETSGEPESELPDVSSDDDDLDRDEEDEGVTKAKNPRPKRVVVQPSGCAMGAPSNVGLGRGRLFGIMTSVALMLLRRRESRAALRRESRGRGV